MHPKKLFSIFALGAFSFIPLSLASDQEKEIGKKENNPARKKIPKTRQQHQEQREELAMYDEDGRKIVMPTVTVADSDFYVSECSDDRCIRESKSMNLDNTDKVKFMTITEAHREGKYPSKAYLKLHDEHPDDAKYFPLEKEHLQPSDQNNPTNYMAIIMARYRRDMGFPPVMNQAAPNASSAEVLNFLRCFADVPETIALDKDELAKIVEAYSFLQFLGKIPQNPTIPEQCQEIKEQTGINSYEDILRVYDEKMTAYHLLDWDNIDLTRFKYQNFKVSDKMVKKVKYVFKKEDPKNKGSLIVDRIYITPPILSQYGVSALKKYADKIRFHNPDSVRGKRMLLFQRIYRLYYKAMGRSANPYYVDWEWCEVQNWPDSMSKSKIYSWTDDEIAEMNDVIENKRLEFIPLKRRNFEAPRPLGKFSGHDESNFTDAKGITGNQDGSISDDETICGKPDNIEKIGSLLKAFLASENSRREAEAKAAAMEEDEEAEFDEEHEKPILAKKKKKKVPESDEEAVFDDKPVQKKKVSDSKKVDSNAAAMANKKKVYESDEEAEFDDNYVIGSRPSASKPKSKPKAKKSPSSKPKFTESEDGVEFTVVKVALSDPADPQKRKALLNRLLEMFRRQTGQKNATEIDWNLSKIHLLQNHLLPFSTNFETAGDIKTIERLLQLNYFKFLDLSKLNDRRIRAYQQLFQFYAAATGKYRNEYDIEWDDVVFTGLPDKLGENFMNWKESKVALLEEALENGRISCVMTDDFREEIEEVEAKLRAEGKLSDDEPVELPSSPGSSSETQNTDEVSSNSPQSTVEPVVVNKHTKHVQVGRWETVPFTPIEEMGKTPTFKAMLLKKSPSNGNKKRNSAMMIAGSEGGNGAMITDETNVTEESAGQGKLKQPRMTTFEPSHAATTAQKSAGDQTTSAGAQSQVIRVGEYAGSTVEEVLAHADSIRESIANYYHLRESFEERSRHRRIINFIIQCLEIMLEDAMNYESSVPIRMGILEVCDYLQVFNDALANLGAASEIEDANALKKLVIAMVKFRARLSGAPLSYLKGKRTVTILPSMISNSELFGCLNLHEKDWQIEILDFFIDNDESPVFKRPDNK